MATSGSQALVLLDVKKESRVTENAEKAANVGAKQGR